MVPPPSTTSWPCKPSLFPIVELLHQLRVKETVPSGKGKRVQVWNAREQALFPPSPYNAFNLADALVMSLQDLWLSTNLVELVEHTNKQLKVKPFRREPP